MICRIFLQFQSTLTSVKFTSLVNIYDKLKACTYNSAIIEYTDDGISITENNDIKIRPGLSTNNNKTIYMNNIGEIDDQEEVETENGMKVLYKNTKTTSTILSLLSLTCNKDMIASYCADKLEIVGIAQCRGHIIPCDIIVGFWSKVPIKFNFYMSNTDIGEYSLNGNEFVLAHNNKYIVPMIYAAREQIYCIGQNLENLYVITASLQKEYRTIMALQDMKIHFDEFFNQDKGKIGLYNNREYTENAKFLFTNEKLQNVFIIPQISLNK